MKTEMIPIRVTPEEKAQLKKAAKLENRNLGNFIMTVLKKHINND